MSLVTPARLLDPTLLLLVAMGVALFVGFRGARAASPRARRARFVAWAAWAALWLAALPAVSSWLHAKVEMRGPDLDQALAGRDLDRVALVVLAGGMRTLDPAVPLGERLDAPTTARVLTAARIYREHRFGVVVVSGPPREARSMTALITSLGVPADRVVEEATSKNTRDNAAHTRDILRARGIDDAVLVTSSVHLRRAVRAFTRAGVRVTPAAAEVRGASSISFDSLLPASTALVRAHAALHETLGLLLR